MIRDGPAFSLRVTVPVLVLVTLLSAAVTWFGTAGWAPSSVRASAHVDIGPLIGTYSGFEVATHAANFVSAFDEDSSSGDIPGDPNAPGAFVDSSRLGNGTILQVTFVAESESAAERGLRDNVRSALDTVGEGIEEQLTAELDGARRSQGRLRENAEEAVARGVPASAAQAPVMRAGEIVADASAALRSLQVAQQRNAAEADALEVDTEPLASGSTRARASLAAGLTAFLLAGGLLLYVRSRHARRPPRRARAISDRHGQP